MHYGPPKEIFGWAMAHPKYRVAPPMMALYYSQLYSFFPLAEYLGIILKLDYWKDQRLNAEHIGGFRYRCKFPAAVKTATASSYRQSLNSSRYIKKIDLYKTDSQNGAFMEPYNISRLLHSI
jgi:hypothetical protein